MAILEGLDARIRLSLEVSGDPKTDESPQWRRVRVQLVQEAGAVFETLIEATVGDVLDLCESISFMLSGHVHETSFTSMDDNIIFMAWDDHKTSIGEAHVAVGFWIGDPYQLMKGYRFVVSRLSIESFVTALGNEV